MSINIFEISLIDDIAVSRELLVSFWRKKKVNRTKHKTNTPMPLNSRFTMLVILSIAYFLSIVS